METSRPALVVAIAGPTASGKTTLLTALKAHYETSVHVYHISQDDYYLDNELIESTEEWKNWDIPSSFSLESFAKAVEAATIQANSETPKGIVLVEGILLFCHPDLISHYNAIIALDLDESIFKERRFARDTWLQENQGYFDKVIIPAHKEHGTIPNIPHCKHFRVDATLLPETLFQSVYEQLEAWRKETS